MTVATSAHVIDMTRARLCYLVRGLWKRIDWERIPQHRRRGISMELLEQLYPIAISERLGRPLNSMRQRSRAVAFFASRDFRLSRKRQAELDWSEDRPVSDSWRAAALSSRSVRKPTTASKLTQPSPTVRSSCSRAPWARLVRSKVPRPPG